MANKLQWLTILIQKSGSKHNPPFPFPHNAITRDVRTYFMHVARTHPTPPSNFCCARWYSRVHNAACRNAGRRPQTCVRKLLFNALARLPAVDRCWVIKYFVRIFNFYTSLVRFFHVPFVCTYVLLLLLITCMYNFKRTIELFKMCVAK